MLVVNFFGAPCAGKSTAASGLHHELKKRYINCELAPEFAKEMVLSDTKALLDDQLLVFAQQNHRLFRLKNKVDIAICDSPLPLSVLYQPTGFWRSFPALVRELFESYDSLNIYIERNHPYDPRHRVQTEPEAEQKNFELKQLLSDWGVKYEVIKAYDDLGKDLAMRLIQELHLTSR
jgi:nicotinamide riboside kinase